MKTPQQVWSGFDARAEPLEIETIRKWTERGADYHEFYFTGEQQGRDRARMYAIYSAPSGARNLPAVLHIHGGGQTVFKLWLEFWNVRGYAALTFNWGGEWENRDRYALWGKRLHHCNHKYAGDKIATVHPSPRESGWYHWTRVSRRALTVLEQQKEVDPERLGIFGISMGGTIVWPFAGMDRRVKAACAIYGAGWNTYPVSKYAPDPRASDPDTCTWRRTMEPEAYAPLVECPVLFLSGTNDFHGKMDWTYDTFKALRGEWRAAFTPRYNHHVAEAEGASLPLWMDTYLKGADPWPKAPTIDVGLDRRSVPLLTLRVDQPSEVKRLAVFYAVKNEDSTSRYWRSVPARRRGAVWTASLPILNTRDRLFAFAQVTYKRGMCMASNFVAVIPSELGRAVATDRAALVIGDFSKNGDGFCTDTIGTDPCGFVKGITRARGPGKRWGIISRTGARILCLKPADPKWQGPDGADLVLEVYCRVPVDLKIGVVPNRASPDSEGYRSEVPLEPAERWQEVRLASSDFTDKEGRALKNWRKIERIEVAFGRHPAKLPVFASFRWATET